MVVGRSRPVGVYLLSLMPYNGPFGCIPCPCPIGETLPVPVEGEWTILEWNIEFLLVIL